MTKHFCDRCGKEIAKPILVMYGTNTDKDDKYNPLKEMHIVEREVCMECKNDMDKSFKWALDEKGETK